MIRTPLREQTVTLNIGGKPIGKIKRLFIGNRYVWAYVSRRSYWGKGDGHFMRKYCGFGLDKGIRKELLGKGIEWIVIDYMGPKGHRIFISNIDEWFLHGIDDQYSKDYGDTVASFGSQVFLDKRFMKEMMA